MTTRSADAGGQLPQDAAVWVTLDAPKGGLTPELMRRLRDALAAAEADDRTRLLVLVGAGGPVFCSGMDVESPGDDRHELGRHAATLYDLMADLRGSRLLTVCAVDGWVSGGGIGLVATCDVVYATPRSRFSLPEVLWGLAPWAVAPFLLSRVTPSTARRMAATGLPLAAEAAATAGLVDEVVPDVRAAVAGLSRRVAVIPTAALARTKQYVAGLSPVGSREAVMVAVADGVGRS